MSFALRNQLKTYLNSIGVLGVDDDYLDAMIAQNPNVDFQTLGQHISANKGAVTEQETPDLGRGRKFTQGHYQSESYDELQELSKSLSVGPTTPVGGGQGITPTQTVGGLGLAQNMPEKPASSFGSLMGGLGWGLLDTVSFGLADYLANDEEWDMLKSTSGQIGQGLGTALGFLVPMGIAKGAVTGAVKGVSWAAKGGKMKSTARAVKDFSTVSRTKIIDDLVKHQKYSPETAAKIADKTLKPMVNTIWSMGGGKSFDTLRSLGQKIPGVNRLINKPVARHSGNLDDLANVQKSVDKGVRNQIKKNFQLATGNSKQLSGKVMDSIEREYKSILGSKGNMPIHSLEQLLATSMGNTKYAAMIASGVEEGLLFTMAENALTIMPSMEEGADPYEFHLLRPMLLGGTLGGLVKFIGGGYSKNMWLGQGGAFDMMTRTKKKGGLFGIKDGLTVEGQQKVAQSAAMLFRFPKMREIFAAIDDDALRYTYKHNGTGRIKIKDPQDMIKVAMDGPEGAAKVIDLMKNVESQARNYWWSAWKTELAKDWTGSLPRMLAGATAFQAPSMFNGEFMHLWENEQELLWFNVMLGAVMSKGGKEIKYKDRSGNWKVATGGLAEKKKYSYSDEFKQVDTFMKMMGQSETSNYFDYLVYDSEIRNRWIGLEKNQDMDAMIQILRDSGAIVGTTQELNLYFNDAGKTNTRELREIVKKEKISLEEAKNKNEVDEHGNLTKLSYNRTKEIGNQLNPVSGFNKMSKGLDVNSHVLNQQGASVYDIITKVLGSEQYEFLVRETGGGKVMDINQLDKKTLDLVTERLLKHEFDGAGQKGIHSMDDLAQVFDFASGKNFEKLSESYLSTAIAIHDEIGKRMYEGTKETFIPAFRNSDGRWEVQDLKINPSDMKDLSSETMRQFDRYTNVLDFLERHNMLDIKKDNKQSIRFKEEHVETLVDLMDQGYMELNNMVWKNQRNPDTGQSYGEDWIKIIDKDNHIQMGDEFLHQWMTSVAFNKATSRAVRMLTDFKNKRGEWNLKTSDKFEDLVGNIFEHNGLLASKVTVEGDNASLDKMLGNVLEILNNSKDYRQPFNTRIEGKTKVISKKDAVQFKKILERQGNGLSGLTHGDFKQRQIFADETVRKLRLSELRDLKDINNNPLNSNQLTEIMFLMDRGMVDKNYNMIGVNKIVNVFKDNINIGRETLNINDVINKSSVIEGPGGVPFLHHGGESIPLRQIFKGPESSKIADSFYRIQKELNIPITEMINDLLTNYKDIIDPYVARGGGKGFLKDGGLFGDFTMDSILELKYGLDFIKQNKVASTHDAFMNTITRLESRKDLTPQMREMTRKMWAHFMDNPKDASQLILEFQNTRIEGVPLYDVLKSEFNWENASALKRTNEILNVFINTMPQRLTTRDLELRQQELGNIFEYIHQVDKQTTVTPIDYINKYRIQGDIGNTELTGNNATLQLLEGYRNIASDPNKGVKHFMRYARQKSKYVRREKSGDKTVTWNEMTDAEKMELTGDTVKLYMNMMSGKKLPKISISEQTGHLDRGNWIKKNIVTDFLDALYGEGNYAAIDYSWYDNSKGTRNARDSQENMEIFAKRLMEVDASMEKNWKESVAGDMNMETGEVSALGYVPFTPHGPMNVLQIGDLGYGIGVGIRHQGVLAQRYYKFSNALKDGKRGLSKHAAEVGLDSKYFDFLFDGNKIKDKYRKVVKEMINVVGDGKDALIHVGKYSIDNVGGGNANIPSGTYDFAKKGDKGYEILANENGADSFLEYSFNVSGVNPKHQNMQLNKVFLDLLGINRLGEAYMEKRISTSGGNSPKDVVRMFDTIKLLENSNMLKLDSKIAVDVANLYTGLLDKTTVNFMKKMSKDGFEMQIIGDEMGLGKGGDIFGGNIFSVLGRYGKEVDKAQDKVEKMKTVNDDGTISEVNKYELETVQEKNGELTFYGKKDASRFDSVTIISERLYQSLKALTGVPHWSGLGGFKPIVHKVGGVEGILVGKTFFGRDAKFEQYMADKGIDMLMTDSAVKASDSFINSKKIDPNQFTSIESLQNTGRKTIKPSDHNIKMRLEDVSIGTVVKADHNAAIQLIAMSMDLKGPEYTDFYNWASKKPIETLQNSLAGIFGANNSEEAISWLLSSKGDGSPMVMDAVTRAATYGAPIQSMPAFKTAFQNILKTKLIDGGGILKPYTEFGTQSVLMPGRGLRDTKFYRDGKQDKGKNRNVFDIGETRISWHNREKVVNPETLKIVSHDPRVPDKITTWAKLEKEINAHMGKSKGDVGYFEVKKLTKLGEVFDYLERVNQKTDGEFQYQIHLNGNRTPSNRPSDKMNLALKGFKSKAEGNQIEINAYDLHLRAEGDFDVDKMNYWWDTPESVSKRWHKTSADTPAAVEGHQPKNSMHSDLDLKDPLSMENISISRQQAQVLRGTVGRIKNLMQYLNHYSSGVTNKEGFFITLNDKSGRIRFDPKKLEKLWNGENYEGGPLLHNFQEILDSKFGFNKEKFNSAFLERILFGDEAKLQRAIKNGDATEMYEGAFVFEQAKGSVKDGDLTKHQQWQKVDGQITDGAVQRLVLEAIKPYQRLLQLSTDVYEGGMGRTPRYQDIINVAREYDIALKHLNWNAYKRIKKDYGYEIADQMFKRNQKMMPVYGGFASKAALNIFNNSAKNHQNLLPFDRIIAELGSRDLMASDAPTRLFGEKLDAFKKFDERFAELDFNETHVGFSTHDAYKSFKDAVHTDFRNLGYLNYLKTRQRSLEKMKNYAYEKGNQGLALSLSERISSIEKKHDFIAREIVIDPKHMKTIASYMKNEMRVKMRHNPRLFMKQFNKMANMSGVKPEFIEGWFNKKAIVNGIAQKYTNGDIVVRNQLRDKGLLLEGINSPEHLEALIFSRIFGRMSEIIIDSNTEFGSIYGDAFNKDINRFNRKWRKIQTSRNKDRGKYSKKNTVVDDQLVTNDAQMGNLMRQEFDALFQNWEGVSPGLGRLALIKIMTPKINPAKMSYFGQQLGPAFQNPRGDQMFIKFGINWINQTERLTGADRNMFYQEMFGQYRQHHDAFYAKGMDSKVFGEHMDIYTKYSAAGHTDPALISKDMLNIENLTTWDNISPALKQAYGLTDNRTMNYLLTTQTTGVDFLGRLNESAYLNYFPQAFVTANYSGGPHPSIGHANLIWAIKGQHRALLGSNLKTSDIKMADLPEVPFTRDVNVRKRDSQFSKDSAIKDAINNKYKNICKP